MLSACKKFVERHQKKLLWITAVVSVYALLGFFLAPWLIKNRMINTARDAYGAELRIEHVAVNPFVFSLRVDGLEMDDPSGDEFARFDRFYANFQLSSLFRWAATFAEIRFDAPEVFIARDGTGELNLGFLLTNETSADDEAEQVESAVARFVLQDLSINDASAHWNDAVPREPVATTFGPVNVQILDLSTLPENEGRQDVVITTETTGTFSWSGSLQLNPLRSAGHASIDGSHFPLLSAYIRDNAGFEVVRGNAGIELDYSIDTMDDGQLEVRVDNLDLSFADVLLRTFGLVASDGSNADRDVLDIPRLRVDGGMLRFPERKAEIGSITIEDGVLGLYRDASGDLNVMSYKSSSELSAEEDEVVEDASTTTDWAVSLDRIDINRIVIGLIDDSVNPSADIGINSLDVSIADINNSSAARFPIDVVISTRSGGSVTAQGAFGVLPETVADLDLTVAGISLALLHPYIRSLADVNLDSGALGMNVKLHTGPEESLSLSGDAAISDFLITETDEGSRLGSWDTLAANQFVLSLTQKTLEISELKFDRPYGDILIAADGSVNLGRVAPGKQSGEQITESEEIDANVSDAPADQDLPVAVTIGRVQINDGAADFADFSLPLPFDVKISELNGTLTTIASESSEPSEAILEGKVDEFGLLQISGTVTPLQPALNTDLQVNFENVAMPKFSAYSVPFAGREIASGKLDLFLGYRLEADKLVGENKIVLRDFELGEKVDHPGATSLPLGLAVALLKSPDGTIDIDLPVRGNVNDPEFRYGRVIGKALVNLVVKIVASPFALLGKLVGVEADELEFITFQDGRADLAPPQQEKVVKLAEVLALRPKLSVQINGVIGREVDGLALRTARLDELVEERITAMASKDGDDESYANQKRQVLEDFFDDAALAEFRTRYTIDEDFDELAYTTELRSQQIAAQNLAEVDFVALSAARAANVRAAILAANPELDQQIVVGSLQAIEKGDDDRIRMKVVLTAGDDSG
jgi:uncharacterized protein involved in outer membrane biogenesis